MKFFKNKFFVSMICVIVVLISPLAFFAWIHVMKFIFGWSTGTTDGWIGFLGAYFGAILSIWGIWYQLNRTFKHEHAKDLIDSRGKLTLESIGTANIGDKIYFRNPGCKNIDKKIINKIEETQGEGGFKICNASPNPLSLFYCKVVYLNKEINFYLPIVRPYSTVNFVINDFLDLSLNKTTKCLDIDSKDNENVEFYIEIIYITKANEKRKVIFNIKKQGGIPISDDSLGNYDGDSSYIKTNCNYMIFNGNKKSK